MKKHNLLAAGRIVFGLLGVAGITTQLINSIQQGRDLVNFFSFFTIESNIFAAIILLIVGIGSFTHKKSNPQFALLRGAATLYMTMTGIIYILLLSGNEVSLQTTIPWVNAVLHYILPVVVLLDWLCFPPKFHLSYGKASLWLVFPVAYLTYSLIRGAFTSWYPYPFIDPVQNGWPTVLVISIIIGMGVTLLALALAFRTPREQPDA